MVITPPHLRERLLEVTQFDQELERFILRRTDYFELVSDAWAANFHASTALEGNPLDLEEVRRSTKNSMRGEPVTDNDPHHQEIVQHVLSWASPDLFQRTWDVELVRKVHFLLTDGLDDAKYLPGRLRDDHDRVQITGKDGTVWFEGAPGVHVLDELTELLRWLRDEAPALHPLVAATVFFHEFESIHPFEDGNGRLGRVLFHAYLQVSGLENAHKCMIEPILTQDPDLYYRILAHADHTGSYTPLLDFVVDAALGAYEEAVTRFRERDLLTVGVDENRKRLLIQAKRRGDWFTVKDATEWVDGRGESSVRNYLLYWEQQGAVESTGTTRDRRFRFADPLRTLTEQAPKQTKGIVEEVKGEEART